MKTIHILGAGGPAGVGLARCLGGIYTITGSDDSQWARLMMECEENTIKNWDMLIPLPDSLIFKGIGTKKCFLPPEDQIILCHDKAKTAELLGDLAPKTYWLRDTTGAGGSGAQMLTNYLPGRNFSVEFVFKNGKELCFFQKLRVSYSVKFRSQGIENRGSSVVSICTDVNQVTEIARAALNLLPGVLNGFYGVDLKEDENGKPKVTEINAGRLLTASYSFYYLTGYNLPLIGVSAFLGDSPPIITEYPLSWGIIRQIDQEPKLFTPEITNAWV